ncbi:LamB/YcsF family protein [Klebsiella pneumoniae]|uniref:LamB/YcsF family protein n=1 Tax=Klebsiella pneumoniae TaxID=573 RepID=UPI00374F2E37
MNIDLNSDLGEGFGAWKMGDDDAMLELVSSANIACGFHGGEPTGILRTLKAAKAHNVTVGAHVSYPDLIGFGRRYIDIASDDLTAGVIYQIGALKSLAAAAGTRVSYVKPHGALYNTIVTDKRQAIALLAALKAADSALPLMVLANSPLESLAQQFGIHILREAFADRAYTASGMLVSRNEPGAVLHDPAVVAARMVQLAQDGTLTAIDGTTLMLAADSICIHGDSPGAVEMARAVYRALTARGISICSAVGRRNNNALLTR